jgi:hypothetical protein
MHGDTSQMRKDEDRQFLLVRDELPGASSLFRLRRPIGATTFAHAFGVSRVARA